MKLVITFFLKKLHLLCKLFGFDFCTLSGFEVIVKERELSNLKIINDQLIIIENLKNPPLSELDFQLLMQHQNQLAGFKDLDPEFSPIYEFSKSYTMTSTERLFHLYKTVEYIVRANIPGDLIECGVWRGGSMMLVAQTLIALGDTSRTLYCCDTFEGHPKPSNKLDIDLWGNAAVNDWNKHKKTDETSSWGYVSMDEVQSNMESTGYPMNKIIFVKGMVEKTLGTIESNKFSLVRLDTDWYDSAKVGLDNLWPKLSIGGVLLVDDYGHYKGQKIAVDKYFEDQPILLNRIDYSCRSITKVE